MTGTRCSEHFTLAEMVHSDVAARRGIVNTPDPLEIASLEWLCGRVLEPMRARFGPLHVTSGFRCPELNAVIGGSAQSDHMWGGAADVVSWHVSPYEIAAWVAGSDLPFKQVILEFDRWVHVSAMPLGQEPRRQALTAFRRRAGGVVYVPGIVPAEELATAGAT